MISDWNHTFLIREYSPALHGSMLRCAAYLYQPLCAFMCRELVVIWQRARLRLTGWTGTSWSTTWLSRTLMPARASPSSVLETASVSPNHSSVVLSFQCEAFVSMWSGKEFHFCGCRPLKGILFWRWDAVAAAVNSQVGDNALTLATSSSVFQVQPPLVLECVNILKMSLISFVVISLLRSSRRCT